MRASERAYEALRRDILNWDLPPGSVLAEVELSERLGVSRTPVREAVAKLVADGLADAQRGRGTVVSDVSLDDLADMFVLRRVLGSRDQHGRPRCRQRSDRSSLSHWHSSVPHLRRRLPNFRGPRTVLSADHRHG